MKKGTLILLLQLCCMVEVFSQNTQTDRYSLKLSGGRVLFGTGDVAGFSIGLEASKNLLKQPRPGLNKLLLGIELHFEHGVKNPQADNPSFDEFIRIMFYHISNTLVQPKLTYFPLGRFLSGFHVAVGPSIGFSYQSGENRAERQQFPNGDFYRASFLHYNNTWLIGYRVSTGYDLNIGRKLVTGARIDLSSYSNGDINTLAGLKVGVRW